jgi:hypothetical protein
MSSASEEFQQTFGRARADFHKFRLLFFLGNKSNLSKFGGLPDIPLLLIKHKRSHCLYTLLPNVLESIFNYFL